MDEPELFGVGKTALGVAQIRAHESQRPDQLFDDPYAAAFVAAAPTAFPDTFPGRAEAAADPLAGVGAAFAVSAVLRTRFFDDYLRQASAAGCGQVVLLAAGLDTAPTGCPGRLTLACSNSTFPLYSTSRNASYTTPPPLPGVRRIVLPVDLRDDWSAAARTAGLDPSQPTAWLCEGLLIYLSADEADHLLTTVSDLSASRSQLAFEHSSTLHPAVMAHARSMPAMKPYTCLWKGGLGHDAPDWLIRHGWSVSIHDCAAFAAAHDRAAPGAAAGAFLTATRHNCP